MHAQAPPDQGQGDETYQQRAQVAGQEVEGVEQARLIRRVMVLVDQEPGHPRPQEVPVDVERDDQGRQHPEALEEQPAWHAWFGEGGRQAGVPIFAPIACAPLQPAIDARHSQNRGQHRPTQRHPGKRLALFVHRRAEPVDDHVQGQQRDQGAQNVQHRKCGTVARHFQVLLADAGQPENGPEHPQGPCNHERIAPAAGLLQQERHQQRRDHRPDGRSALEDAVAQRALRRGKDALGGAQGAGPVASLGQAQQEAKEQQVSEALGQPRGKAGQRPGDHRQRVDQAHVDPVRHEAHHNGPDCKGPTKRRLQQPVIALRQPEGIHDLLAHLVDGQPIHVVDRSGQQQQSADPPFPGRTAVVKTDIEGGIAHRIDRHYGGKLSAV